MIGNEDDGLDLELRRKIQQGRVAIPSRGDSKAHKTPLWLSRKDQSLTSASENPTTNPGSATHQPGASGNPFSLSRACFHILGNADDTFLLSLNEAVYMKWALPSTTEYPSKSHDTHLPQQPQASMPTQLWGGNNIFHPLPRHCCLSAGMAFRPSVAPTVSAPQKSPLHSLVPLQTFDCCFLFPALGPPSPPGCAPWLFHTWLI